MKFPTEYDQILDLVENFDPTNYAHTRNYTFGSVSRLSPYISRGVVSTKQIRDNLVLRGFDISHIEKFIQELAWRDYWQQIWIAKGELINQDLKQKQTNVDHHEIPLAVLNASTGIDAIDSAIVDFYNTGYLHNHVRMYVAAIACNFGRSHWLNPAQWLYYHLLDGDWASNALSWQWVVGSNSNKQYIADQQNINRYTDTLQSGTFLDDAYSRFSDMDVPARLRATKAFEGITPLPPHEVSRLDNTLPTYLYNWYNLDPAWDDGVDANRVLLLEPSIFEKHPISEKSVQFMLDLSKNINGVRVAVCEFAELANQNTEVSFQFKEHPLNHHYVGQQHPRDWMSGVVGYHSSFFKFWKQGRAECLAL